jgi:hypothetical protein
MLRHRRAMHQLGSANHDRNEACDTHVADEEISIVGTILCQLGDS